MRFAVKQFWTDQRLWVMVLFVSCGFLIDLAALFDWRAVSLKFVDMTALTTQIAAKREFAPEYPIAARAPVPRPVVAMPAIQSSPAPGDPQTRDPTDDNAISAAPPPAPAPPLERQQADNPITAPRDQANPAAVSTEQRLRTASSAAAPTPDPSRSAAIQSSLLMAQVELESATNMIRILKNEASQKQQTLLYWLDEKVKVVGKLIADEAEYRSTVPTTSARRNELLQIGNPSAAATDHPIVRVGESGPPVASSMGKVVSTYTNGQSGERTSELSGSVSHFASAGPAWKPFEMWFASATALGAMVMLVLSARKDRREAQEAALKVEELRLKLAQMRSSSPAPPSMPMLSATPVTG